MKRKKLIAFLLFASLIGIFTVALIQQPQPTPPFLPPTQTGGATQTPKTPTIQSLTSEKLRIYPSALNNWTGVSAEEDFNGGFLGLSAPSGVSNINYVLALLEAYSIEQGIKYPALNKLFPSFFPFWSTWDKPRGVIGVEASGTSSSANQSCQNAMNQAFNQIKQALSTTYGIIIQEQYNFTTIEKDDGTSNLLGVLVFNTTNTPDEVYNALNESVPSNTLAENIANESTPIHIIQVMDFITNYSLIWQTTSFLYVGATIQGQVGTTPNGNYTSSTRKLLNIPAGTNITSQAPSTQITITLPTNSNITNYYPPTAGIFTTPQNNIYYAPIGYLNVDDVNVTYTLSIQTLPTALILALILSSTQQQSTTPTYIAIAGAAAGATAIAIGLAWMLSRSESEMPPTQTEPKKWKEI